MVSKMVLVTFKIMYRDRDVIFTAKSISFLWNVLGYAVTWQACFLTIIKKSRPIQLRGVS
jgi:hypothetical protein